MLSELAYEVDNTITIIYVNSINAKRSDTAAVLLLQIGVHNMHDSTS